MAAKLKHTEQNSWRPREFARRHGVSAAFIYTQIAAGLLPARKAGSVTLINITDEAAWLASMPSMHSKRHVGPEAA